MIDLVSHLQTMSAMLPLSRIGATRGAEQIILPIPGGGELVAEAQWQKSRAPVVVVLHGIAGSSRDPYVVRAAHGARARGFHVVRLNQRGSGLGQRRAATLYHAGLTEDLELLLQHLAARPDVSQVYLLGFSLGGHLALRYAGEKRLARKLAGIATISAPIDLPQTLLHLRHTSSSLVGFYRGLMVKSIVTAAHAMLDFCEQQQRESPIPRERLRRVKTMVDVNDHITAPLSGYPSAEVYADAVSAKHRVGNIDVPALLIHADDDPVVPAAQVREVSGRNSLITPCVVRGGGHVGFHHTIDQLLGTSFAVQSALSFFDGVEHGKLSLI